MIYRLLQYYNDELSAWSRTMNSHKVELREFVCKITAVLDQQTISSVREKESDNYIDQFLVQEQKFDYIINLISSQLLRLEKVTLFLEKPLEHSTNQKQDLLRQAMYSAERNFIRTKHTCAIFLASFLGESLATSRRAHAGTQLQ